MRISLVLVALAIAALLLSGPGTRAGWWHFRVGLLLFLAAGLLGLAGAITAFVLWRKHPDSTMLLVAVAGLVIFGLLANGFARGIGKPPIHDISTDLDDPPSFSAVLPLRAKGSNSVAFDPRVAMQQRKAYPDLKPGEVEQDAFERALTAANESGWQIVSARPEEGVIEATDTTSWFGFRDDIAIRVRGSRVDVRSSSRVGTSDVGANAARIRRYLARLQG